MSLFAFRRPFEGLRAGRAKSRNSTEHSYGKCYKTTYRLCVLSVSAVIFASWVNLMCPGLRIFYCRITSVWLILLAMAAPAASAEQWGYVRWVYDGDTVILSDDRRVRYIGINAPEMAREQHPAEPYAKAATRANRELVYRKRTLLEVGREPADRYGRILAYVFLPDGRFVNEALVRSGVAVVLPKAPNLKYEKRLLAAQRKEMSAGKGMWHNWRHRRTRLVGNGRSKRFHHPSCSRAARIHPKNRVLFENLWDAFWDGYAPARGCFPTTPWLRRPPR